MKSLWRPILLKAPTLALFILAISPSPTLSTPVYYQGVPELNEQQLASLFPDRLHSPASFLPVSDIHHDEDVNESFEDNEDTDDYSLVPASTAADYSLISESAAHSLIPEFGSADYSLVPESAAIKFLRARVTRSDSPQRVQRAQQAFMRIGRAPQQASMYTRIGKSSPTKSSAYTRIGRAASSKQFMRLGRASTKQFMRLGRAPPQQFTRLGRASTKQFMRLGKRAAPSQQFTRLGRASTKQFMRLGRASTKQFMRLGRASTKQFMRLGRSYNPYTRNSRAAHLYTRMGRSAPSKHHQTLYKSNDALKRADHIFTRIGRSGPKANLKRQGLFTRMGRIPATIPAQHQTGSQTSFEDDNEDMVPELGEDEMQLFIDNMAAINSYPSPHMDEDDLYRTNYEDDLYVNDMDDDISDAVRFGGKQYNDNDLAENDEQNKDDHEQSSRNIHKESSI